jgi:hypothetical protein
LVLAVAADKSKPTSYRETFKRHRKLFCLPMLLGVVAAGYLAVQTGKTFTATTSLWVDTAPPVASSASSDSPPLSSAPAAAEQGILTELLTTNDFAVAVAKNSLLGKYLGGGDAAVENNAANALEQGQVAGTISGQQVLKISYTGPSPDVAKTTVAAIAQQLKVFNDKLTGQHDDAAVTYAQQQVTQASKTLAAARNALSQYLSQHPSAGQSDPNFAALSSAEVNANNSLGSANTALAQAVGARASGGWTMQLIDEPTVFPVAKGKKKMVEEILGGLIGGALLSLLVVIALTPAKKDPWDEDDFPSASPVARGMRPDPFDPSTVPPAPAPALRSERRLILRTPNRDHH